MKVRYLALLMILLVLPSCDENALHRKSERSQRIVETKKDSRGQIVDQWRYEYNAETRVKKFIRFDQNHNVRMHNHELHNEAGQVIKTVRFNNLKDVERITHYSYDAQGRYIGLKSFDNKGKLLVQHIKAVSYTHLTLPTN